MHHIQQDTIYISHNRTKEIQYYKVASMGYYNQRSNMQIIPSKNKIPIEIEDSNYSGIYIHHYWSRQNKGLSTQVQVDRQSAMPLQQGRTDIRPHNLQLREN
ncbi:hypothetical protein C0J52_19991 [Blattella germanica]|nr:hypothetical protein C0J52_19991 [Blattella germanica]